MDTLRQIGGSLLLALFSAALVIGGISLALAESYVPEIPPTPTETQVVIQILSSPTPQPSEPLPETPTPSPSVTPTPPLSCPPPAGWIAVVVGPGEDLNMLASRHQSTPQELIDGNCLFSTELPTGSLLYVPPLPTKTPVPCGPPPGWIQYTVQSGNTMYSLSQAYGVSISQLQRANCMSSSQYNLTVGQRIWVPNVITRTPLPTATRTSTPISIIFPTLTWTTTITPTATGTATQAPTSTATGTAPPTFTYTTTAPPPTTLPPATATITAFPSTTP